MLITTLICVIISSASGNDALCVGVPDLTFVNDPSMCSKYFLCWNGAAVSGWCPYPFAFNPANSKCDHQDVIPCFLTHAETVCRGKPDKTFVSDPDSCTNWFRCENTFGVIGSCPPGFYFEPVMQVCDYPENVDCHLGNPDPMCLNASPTDFFPVPGNCVNFFRCDDRGVLIEGSCPDGFKFNPFNSICDHPENVLCDNNGGSITTTSKPPTPETTTIPTEPADPQCVGIPAGQFVASTEACDLYYHCNANGVATQGQCPAGFYFTTQFQGCDWPHLVLDCPVV